VPPHARVFTRAVKGAQEAHEAIRPTKIHRTPEILKPSLAANQFKLYQLIWNRMIASQMAAAINDNTTSTLKPSAVVLRMPTFSAHQARLTRFLGFTILYSREEGKDRRRSKQETATAVG